MKLLGSTVLFHNDESVTYEILLVQDMILFKPYFYHLEPYPCIVLSRLSTGWQFQEKVNTQIENQVREDLVRLRLAPAA